MKHYLFITILLFSSKLIIGQIEPIQLQPSPYKGGVLKAVTEAIDGSDTMYFYQHDTLVGLVDTVYQGFPGGPWIFVINGVEYTSGDGGYQGISIDEIGIGLGLGQNATRQFGFTALPKVGFFSGYDDALYVDEDSNNENGILLRRNDSLFYDACLGCTEEFITKLDTSNVGDVQSLTLLDSVNRIFRLQISGGNIVKWKDEVGITSETGDISAVNVSAPVIGGGTTGVVTIGVDTTATNMKALATQFDLTSKQNQLNGTGFVKSTGTTISYDNSTYVPTSRTITTNAPISGGGDLSTNRTLVLDTTSTKGAATQFDLLSYMPTTRTLSTSLPLIGGGNLNSNLTLGINQANTSTSGFLSSTDWNTFIGKVGGNGTVNYLPKWSATNTLGNSIIQDNGTNVGIGVVPQSFYKLAVNGHIYSGDDNSNVYVGRSAGDNTTSGTNNVALGVAALTQLSTGYKNFGLGTRAGNNCIGCSDNVLIGFEAGFSNNSANNVFIGSEAGRNCTLYNNTGIGLWSLYNAGYSNIGIGRESGYSSTGNENVFIGNNSGRNAASGNVMIGNESGYYETGSGKLYIDNSNTTSPLIGGDFSNNRVGINTAIGSIANTLHVTGGTRITSLAGVGSRMVTADANGDLGTASIPVDTDTDDQKIDVFSITSNTLNLSLENDGEATKTVSLAPYLDNTDNQDLTLSSNILSLTNDATTVNLGPYLDNTDSQTISALDSVNGVHRFQVSGGNIFQFKDDVGLLSEVDGSVTNEIQDLSLSGQTLSLTSDATTVTLPIIDVAQGSGITVSKVNGVATVNAVADGDGSSTNEIQTVDQFNITSNTLSLSLSSDGVAPSTVNLAPYLDNTDNQAISKDSTGTADNKVIGYSVANGGRISVRISDTQDISKDSTGTASNKVIGFSVVNGGRVTIRETDNQDLTLTGNTLSLTNDASSVTLDTTSTKGFATQFDLTSKLGLDANVNNYLIKATGTSTDTVPIFHNRKNKFTIGTSSTDYTSASDNSITIRGAGDQLQWFNQPTIHLHNGTNNWGWGNNNSELVAIYNGNYLMRMTSNGLPRFPNLNSSGTLYVTADATGTLGTTSLPNMVTSVSGTLPISSSGGPTPNISIATANTTTTGALTSTDWNTFNGKQAALVSGTNIKTVNGTTLLGSGNITTGTVTSVSTGTGLTGGPITSTGTIALSTQLTNLHNLSTGGIMVQTGTTAGAGTFTGRSITSTGATMIITNGSGVAGNINVELADGSVSVNKIVNSAVTSAKIADATIVAADIANTGVSAGTYSNVTVNSKGQVTAASAVPWCQSYGNTGAQTVAASTTSTYNIQNSVNNFATFYTVSAVNDDITILQAGDYELTFNTSTIAPSGGTFFIEKWNGTAWGSWVNNSELGFIASTTASYSNNSISVIGALAVNEKLRVRIQNYSTTTNLEYYRGTINIKKM